MPAAERQRFFCNIRSETERIQHIVDQLLQLSTLEAKGGRLELAPVELREVVGTVAETLRPATIARSVNLGIARSEPLTVNAERFFLRQALTNLLQNALEFTPRGGTVVVAVERSSDRAIITVDDSGPGIPAHALSQVFERFYSLPRPDTGRKSTGLGLSFTREVVTLHGGTLELSNRAEGGVRARVSLPVA